METIRGRMSLDLDLDGLKDRLASYNRIVLDLGTGDGRYVRTLAEKQPDWFMIGVDACREKLHEHSRAKLPNMLFVVACAQDLPCKFYGLFRQVTVNFPWGSLLESLLTGDTGMMKGLSSVVRPNARIEICLNAGALQKAGASLETGTQTIHNHMAHHGWKLQTPYPMDHRVLKHFPSTWAKQLAHGRDPRAMGLSGRLAY